MDSDERDASITLNMFKIKESQFEHIKEVASVGESTQNEEKPFVFNPEMINSDEII
jgi:hypothetical protein